MPSENPNRGINRSARRTAPTPSNNNVPFTIFSGFNTIDTAGLSEAGYLLTIIMMFIGGSPGSPAGGSLRITYRRLHLVVCQGKRKCEASDSAKIHQQKVGDCTNIGVLKSLGVGNFDLCFICIGTNFQSSLEITMFAPK